MKRPGGVSSVSLRNTLKVSMKTVYRYVRELKDMGHEISNAGKNHTTHAIYRLKE
jgi:biotin operon repressor